MPKPDDDRPSGSGAGTSLRERVHDVLEHDMTLNPLAGWINGFLIALILLNVIAVAMETVPDLGERYGPVFHAFNIVSVLIFTAEYILRLWSAVESPILRAVPRWQARLRFATRPMMLIDLMAILPFYLSIIFAIDLRLLRVLRLFRFLKLARYSPALHSIARVLIIERRALLGALMVMMTLLLFAASGIYLLEREAQPEVFSSIPAAAWWALATLTTVGYGDVVPITPAGKLLGGLFMIFGLGMFALPIAIVATGFAQEANRRDFVVTWSMVARVPIFADLDARTVAEITALLYARSYAEGEVIVRAGDETEGMFFISTGEVRVDADAGPVILSSGDFFGEMALFDRRERRHAVTAITRTRVLVLGQDDFDRLCRGAPEIVDQIRQVARARGNADAQTIDGPEAGSDA